MEEKSAQKLNYGKTILIGFGFLASSVAWAIYDPYVTRILNEILGRSEVIASWGQKIAQAFPFVIKLMEAQGESTVDAAGAFTLVPLFVGIVMTFDNIFGVIFQPFFGKLSDHTHSRFGKRRPFIFVGAPLSAIFFALIPLMDTIPSLMFCIIMYVMIMSFWRAPVVALMPDLTPPKLRSEGNAVINLCGGLGSLIGMVAGTVVCFIFGYNSDLHEEFPAVFLLGSIIMIISTIILFFFVKEPDSRLKHQAQANADADEKLKMQEEKKAEKERLKAIKLTRGEKRSLIFMLLCLFFLFVATNAIQTFFSLFAGEVLGKSTQEATIMMALFAVCSMIAAIPAGKLGAKLGRKKVIIGGLIVFMAIFALYAVTKELAVVWVALVLGGFANMFITVNTLPLVLEIGGVEKIGTFTGYYYTATFSAQIVAPILFGTVRMFSGTYMSLFVFCPIAFALALFCIMFVKHGEAKDTITNEMVKQIEAENMD